MCTLCNTFPSLPEKVLSRDKYIDLIDDQFNNHKILCIESNEGVGITTLIAMFAQRHAESCVSYFFDNGMTMLNSHSDFEKSMLKQLSYYARKGDSVQEKIDRANALMFRTMRLARSRKGFLYFAIDGLERIPSESVDGYRKLLVQWMNCENARFLFSGNRDTIASIFTDIKDVYQTNQLLPFDKMELKDLLFQSSISVTEDQLKMFHHLTGGIASKVQMLLDHLKEDDDFTYVEELYKHNVNDLYEYVWENANQTECPKSNIVFAILSLSGLLLKEDLLCNIVGISKTELENILETHKEILEVRDGIIYFRNKGFKNYVGKKLKSLNGEVELLLINMYESLDVEDTFSYLPSLYKKSNKKSELVKYLTSDNVQHFLEKERSQAALNEQCEYGYAACLKTETQASDYFRFAINRSASREIEKNELTDSEIEALIAIGEEESAFALVQDIYLKEEKLKCLLIIARNAKHMSDSLQKEILSQIKALVQSIRFEHIPDKAIELAKLMLPVDFVEALTIIDSVSNLQKDKTRIDRLYTALSLSFNTEGDEKENIAKADLLSTKIEDSDLRKMAKSMKSIMADCSVDELLSEIEKLPNSSSRLYFLQFWIPDHCDIDNIGKIVCYAVNLVMQNSDASVPKVSLLKKYCAPLPKMHASEITEVISMMDAFTDSIKFPTLDYVDLQLILIQAQFTYDKEAAGDRLINLYIEIDEYADKSLTVKCKAKVLSRYDSLGDKKITESYLQTPLTIQNEIVEEVKKLFKENAFHLRIVDVAIKELVCDYRSFIDDVVPLMNTEERQSRAYMIALNEYVNRTDVSKMDWTFVNKLFKMVSYNPMELDRIIIRLVRKIVFAEVNHDIALEAIKKNYHRILEIEESDRKCYSLSILYVWLKKHFPSEDLCSNVKEQLDASWDAIIIPIQKIEIGYKIAKVLSDIPMKEEARAYVEKSKSERKSLIVSSYSCMSAFQESLSHYIHSLGILVRAGLYKDSDFAELENILVYNDDEGDTMIAWARIALEFNISGNTEKFKEIVTKYLSKDINKFPKFYRRYVFYHISPALFLAENDYYFSKLDKYDKYFSNMCIENVANYICNKYPYPGCSETRRIASNRAMEYDDFMGLIKLMRHSHDDSFIFDKIETVASGIIANESKVSKDQRNYLFGELEKLVNEKLPLNGGIKHEGYKIACLATIKRYKNPSVNDWSAEKKKIEAITNEADKAFLYAHIAHCASKTDVRLAFIEEAVKISKAMTSFYDRMNRLDMCLSESFDITSGQKSKSLARETMQLLLTDKNGDFNDLQNYVDHVRELDAVVADEMLEMIDKDPARISYRNKLKANKIKNNKLLSAKKDLNKISTLSNEEQIQFFERQLEELVKGRYTAKDISNTISVLNKIYENPITDTSNAIVYFMENAYNKHKLNNLYSDLLRSIYSTWLCNLKIVMAIAAGTQDRLDKVNRIMSRKHDGNGMIIRGGEEERAHEILKTWIKNNPSSQLRICDAYIKTEDFSLLKSFFDIIPELQISILTHKQQYENLDVFQKAWNRISSELTGSISIKTVCYKDETGKSPIHDRWWVLLNDETGEKVGIRLPSINGLGHRVSEISNMDENAIHDFNNVWSDFYFDNIKWENGRKLIYDDIVIK